MRLCLGRAMWVALLLLLRPQPPLEAADPPHIPTAPSLPVRLAPDYHERWLAPGLCRSSTLRALVADLAESDVLVYVVTRYGSSRRIAGDLQFVHASPTARILRVTINLRAVGHSPDAAIAMLGHELRHALEVAQDPDIRSTDAFAAFYRAHGTETDWGVFDTAAARQSEREVRDQLLQSSDMSCAPTDDTLVADR